MLPRYILKLNNICTNNMSLSTLFLKNRISRENIENKSF